MKYYILKRLLLMIPTLIIISIIAFLLSKQVPQDQVQSVMALRGVEYNKEFNPDALYESIYRELNLDLPIFYFSVVPHSYPRNINSESNPYVRDFYKAHLKAHFRYEDLSQFVTEYESLQKENPNLGLIHKIAPLSEVDVLPQELKAPYQKLLDKRNHFFWPKAIWHGSHNQYHKWISSFFDGSFGVSLVDGQSAFSKVRKALAWTLSISIFDFLISLPLGIFIGYWLGRNPDGKKETVVSQILYFIYAIPLFWLATLLIVFFTSNEYGSWTNIFPSVGIDIYPGRSTGYHILHNLSKLLLPVFCLVIHSLAYSSRFVRRSILNEMHKDYVMTAYSKGLDRNQTIRRHVLPNALIPVITILVAMIPAALASSLVLEVIFNIPGVGRLMFNSIFQADWDVSFCILMIIATVTVISFLIGDILYALVSPKLRFE